MRQTGGQRRTRGQRDRRVDRDTGVERQTDRCPGRQTGGQTDGWVDRQTDGWTDLGSTGDIRRLTVLPRQHTDHLERQTDR